MAAKRVSRKRGRAGKRGRKPPLHIVSDYGTRQNTPLARKVGNNKMVKSKGDYGAK